MKEQLIDEGFNEREMAAAIKSLNSASFKKRFIQTHCNAADPVWKISGGKTVNEHVRDQMNHFKNDVETLGVRDFHSGVFQKFDANTLLTIGFHQLTKPFIPSSRDLLHVYGADRDNIKDWTKYYRYAWKQKGPNGIIFSTDEQIIREGKLACNSYAYSGQGSYAIAGAGMLFRPLFGDAIVSIRPYVQWLTSASFTGTESTNALATANLGIYVESWPASGGSLFTERDIWIPVWSQNTQSYIINNQAGGAANVSDGLATELLTVTQRKYAIYVYAYLETSADPQQHKNEQRFVTLDIDATVPFVVVEEKLV